MNPKQQIAHLRMAAFDSLPRPVRVAIEATKVVPDIRAVAELWDQARGEQGEEEATSWMLQSIEAWNQQCGGSRPITPKKRNRREAKHRLAPPVPEYRRHG